MTSMLELVEASAGVYPLLYGPGMDLSPPTVPGWHSRGVDFPPFLQDPHLIRHK